ncbi:MAG: hypothetical protein AB1430_04065 [Pseudomonadota bacterium]
MNTSLGLRLASFSAACVMTLAILVGVHSMAITAPAPDMLAQAGAVAGNG